MSAASLRTTGTEVIVTEAGGPDQGPEGATVTTVTEGG